jgi:hypothetical protein
VDEPLSEYFDLAHIVMLFLLTALLVAARLGRGPANLPSPPTIYADFEVRQSLYAFFTCPC